MFRNYRNFVLSLLVILVIPLVSAQYNPYFFEDLFNNSWLRFGIILVLFFVILNYATQRSFFKENKAAGTAVAAVIALLTSLSLAQTGLFHTYLGDSFGSWVLGLTLLVGIILFVKITYDGLGAWGAGFVLFIIWVILRVYTNPADYFPVSQAGDTLLFVYEALTGFFGIIVIIVLVIVFAALKKKKKKKGININLNH